MEENYKSKSPYIPYVGVDIGYGQLNHDGPRSDTDTGFVRFSFGLKYFIEDNAAITTSIKASWSFDDLYLKGNNEVDDKDWGLGIGLRYYY